MEPLARLEAGVNQAHQVVSKVPPSSYSAPTPCPDWNVGELINHMLAALVMFREVGAKGSVDPSALAGDFRGDDPAASMEQIGHDAVKAWSVPGRIEGVAALPFGEFPASMALGAPAMDMVVHSWDLSRATGVPVVWDDALVRDTLEFSQATFSDPDSRGDSFGDPVPVGAGADDLTALVAFLGRHP